MATVSRAPATLVGNGAYVLKDWVVQSHVELERNPRYTTTNDKTTIDTVVLLRDREMRRPNFSRYRADETRLHQFRAGASSGFHQEDDAG